MFDIARDGRALISLGDVRVSMTAQLAGDRRAPRRRTRPRLVAGQPMGGAYPLEPLAIWKQFLNGGTPVSLANTPYMDYVEVSPDGSRFAGIAGNRLQLFDMRSEQTQPLLPGERAAPVYVATLGDKPDRILKVNLRSGQREVWKTIAGPGLRLTSVVAAPEAGAFAYSTEFFRSRLYLVDGWS